MSKRAIEPNPDRKGGYTRAGVAFSKDLQPNTGNRAGAEAVGGNRFEVNGNSWVNPTYLMQNLNKKPPDNRTEVK